MARERRDGNDDSGGVMTLELELTEGCAKRLQVRVAQYNVAQGAGLDLRGWVLLHLRELAIEAELTAAAQAVKEQAERDATAALVATRERLLEAV